MLTASWGTSLNGWVICYALSQFFYGIGVGGEYPMTSTTAMESKVMTNSQTDDKLHRGRNVVLAFLMQGMFISLGCSCRSRKEWLTFRLGSIIQPSHVDCPTHHLPPWIWKPTLFRGISSMDI